MLCSDGETFISADDLRVNLWNLEISNQSFNIVDVKPANMEDLTGISTCCVCFWVLFFFPFCFLSLFLLCGYYLVGSGIPIYPPQTNSSPLIPSWVWGYCRFFFTFHGVNISQRFIQKLICDLNSPHWEGMI